MNNFQIRKAIPNTDYEQIAALLSEIWDDPLNESMLRINRKLGYEPKPGELRMKLIL